MTHPPAFDDAWARLNRAKSNRERLKAEIEAWGKIHSRACTAGPEYERDNQIRIVNGRIRLIATVSEHPPKEWGLLVGDILVDLRSALDYAIYALAIVHTGTDPPPEADALEFPIAADSTWFHSKRAQRKITGLSKDARDYIKQVQPYQALYGGPGGLHVHSPLWILNELVGVNKHRFIHVFWLMLSAEQYKFVPSPTAEIVDLRVRKVEGELKTGTVIADFRIVTKSQKAKVQLGVGLTPFVAFQPVSAMPLTEVYTGLGKIGGPVEDVLMHLQGFL